MESWIRAKDMLPEVNEAGISKDVLILYSDKRRGYTEMCVGFYRANVGWNFRKGRDVSDLGKKIQVTHWMPLPELPRLEQKGDHDHGKARVP